MFREYPLFGVGMDEFAKHATLVAHNSYLHAYAELGMFGGTIFLGLFFFAFVALFRIGRVEDSAGTPASGPVHPEGIRIGRAEGGDAMLLSPTPLTPAMRRTQPFLMGVVAAYAVAMLALSRGFTVPTYLIVGLVAAFANVCTEPETEPVVRVEVRLVQQMAFLSALFVAGLYVFVRVFNRGA
jgi:O-antigen ligase